VAHRRAGKTLAIINELIWRAIEASRPHARFAYIAPFLKQAKAIAWDYFKRYVPAGLAVFNENELRIDFGNGARIQLFGADNAAALRGHYFDGVVLDEYGDTDPSVFNEVIRPALADRQGFAVFAGTSRGRNHFHTLVEQARRGLPDHQLFDLKASQTHVLPQGELDAARSSMGEHAYNREMETSFDAPIEGTYYAGDIFRADLDGRICDFLPVEPTVRVNTAWDIGVDDLTAIWFFQEVGREVRIIGYLETSGEGVADVVRRLEEIGYRYGRHLMPHDAAAREIGTGKSYRELAEACGLRNIEIVPRTESLVSAINATRLFIARCWFDRTRCAKGLEALRQYGREWDDSRKAFRERPRHDWASHAADAFRTLAHGRPPVRERPTPIEVPNFGVV